MPELLLRTDVPMHKRVLPKDAAILAQATSEAETLRMGDRGEKPRRRLHLTLPSGLAGAQPLPGESAGVDRVEITFFLPKAVISALEEEWWRRQCLGEDASRSDIVRVAVQEVLSHPDLLTKALRQAANQP